jgi:hypothetical protein
MEIRQQPGMRVNPKVKLDAKGGFSISKENLLTQLSVERDKPPSPDRDAMLAHMESLLAEMEGQA